MDDGGALHGIAKVIGEPAEFGFDRSCYRFRRLPVIEANVEMRHDRRSFESRDYQHEGNVKGGRDRDHDPIEVADRNIPLSPVKIDRTGYRVGYFQLLRCAQSVDHNFRCYLQHRPTTGVGPRVVLEFRKMQADCTPENVRGSLWSWPGRPLPALAD